jgi:hypothetical protein
LQRESDGATEHGTERLRTFRRQLRDRKDVGGRVQVALRVTADELTNLADQRRERAKHYRVGASKLVCEDKTAKITAVDQPNKMIPFIVAAGPSSCQRATGTTSP